MFCRRTDNEQAQCEQDLGDCEIDLFQCTSGGDLAQCNADLTQAQDDLTQCTVDLNECLTDPRDADEDGEPDVTDLCPATPAVEVDSDGCSLLQFCTSIPTATKTDERACKRSDWKNDEPLGNARDCTVDKASGECVAR